MCLDSGKGFFQLLWWFLYLIVNSFSFKCGSEYVKTRALIYLNKEANYEYGIEPYKVLSADRSKLKNKEFGSSLQISENRMNFLRVFAKCQETTPFLNWAPLNLKLALQN